MAVLSLNLSKKKKEEVYSERYLCVVVIFPHLWAASFYPHLALWDDTVSGIILKPRWEM